MAHSMPGGAKPVDGAANDAGIAESAKFAVEQHNKKENSDLKLLKVVSATKQVVAGTLTKIKLWAADSAANTVTEYEASIWEKPWENFKEVNEFKPVEGSSRSATDSEIQLVKEGKLITESGSESPGEAVSVADPAVQQAAEKAVAALQRRSNSLYPYQLKGVKSASLQRDPDGDGSALFFLALELTRGPSNAVETQEVKVQVSGDGKWSLQ